LPDCITFFKDYSQLLVSYKQIQEDILTYRETKDSGFKGKYMFDMEDVAVSYPIHYLSINNYVRGSYW